MANCTVTDIARLKRTYAPACILTAAATESRITLSTHFVLGHADRGQRPRDRTERDPARGPGVRRPGGAGHVGNPLYRGVVIRWNRWSDITGGTHCGAAGVRLDDMISGVTVHGNVFECCGAVLFAGPDHGGKENVVDNNLFVDCFAGSVSRVGATTLGEASPGSCRTPLRRRTRALPGPGGVERRRGRQLGDANAFVRCGTVFLRDGGIQRRTDTAIDGPFDTRVMADAGAIAADRRLAAILGRRSRWMRSARTIIPAPAARSNAGHTSSKQKENGG